MIERKYRKQQYILETFFACFYHGNLSVFTNKRKKNAWKTTGIS